jgi:glycosyltransferase involved in cell wall biosynthesis
VRVLFVNENIGGNATMHAHLRATIGDHPDIDASFFDVPRRRLPRRLAGVHVPGLARLDLDLAALRDQLAGSAVVRRALSRRLDGLDAVHVYTQNTALLSVPLLDRRPTVVATDATGLQSARLLPYRRPGPGTDWSTRVGRRFEERVYGAAGAIVAQSEWARRSFVDDYGIAPERVEVIPYGIVVPDRPDVAEDDPPTICFIGRSMARKGGWRLLDVWERRLRRHARLVLVTPEPVPERAGLEVIRDLRPGDAARRNRLLAAAAVFAFPSEMDTFGYAPIEAMAVGTPVVAYRATALPETVPDGRCGLLVEPGDDDGLADALERLLGDAALRRRMGDAARQHVLDRFDARRTTAQVADVLRRLRS